MMDHPPKAELPDGARPLGSYFAHLTDDDGCLPIAVDPSFWEKGVGQLPPGRLISVVESDADWQSWECHPLGEEFILQLSGKLVLILERNGSTTTVELNAGEFVIVPRGTWHTADVPEPGQALFITPGSRTENRPR